MGVVKITILSHFTSVSYSIVPVVKITTDGTNISKFNGLKLYNW